MAHPDRPIAFVLASTNHGSMIVNRHDYRMDGADRGIGVGWQLLSHSSFDPKEVAIALALLDKRRKYFGNGVVAIDGGANIGVHTVEWARHMAGWGSVVAFEAQEFVFYALAGNIALNNCLNARARFAALGETTGDIAIPQPNYLQPASFGSLELRAREGNEDIGQPVSYAAEKMATVPLVNLDAMNIGRLDLLKLDIEGMEIEALRGARETLQRHKPALLVEVIKSDEAAIGELLAQLGYRSHRVGMNIVATHESDPTQVALKHHGKRVDLTIG
ncbi:FkbM family methyltransferase [Ramlibacter albus]|uniref:FkbM family methyltransferase n=1 Tax=Ramlibacter albus TaxID=2079448 RepID=A0A923S3N7_9BURK|nr:FkbM family methyltransferase [Ramlibacter albus]MBC5763297.1 FkbM family methyltransferase [Ramlibacter albus]